MKVSWKNYVLIFTFIGACFVIPRQTTTGTWEWDKFFLTKSFKQKFWYHDEQVISRTKNCESYFTHFVPVPLNDSGIPLAFSHLVHTQAAILEVFLSLYFRPNNYYCIHIDKKSNSKFKEAITNLVKCYSTKIKTGKIYILSEKDSFSVDWGGNTILKADLNCLSKQLEINHRISQTLRWSHSVSVAGSELPIVTYSSFRNEITEKLGQDLSAVESFSMPDENFKRLSDEQLRDIKNSSNGMLGKSVFEILSPLNQESRTSPTHNSSSNTKIGFRVFKGIRNVILSSRDVDFLLNNELSKNLLNWFSKGSFTEEHFYSTLIRFMFDNHDINFVTQNKSARKIRKNKGGITFTSGNTLHGICPRFTSWSCKDCFGKCRNGICNFSLQDLAKIQEESAECLIANKFNLDVDPEAVSNHWIKLLSKMLNKTMNNGIKGRSYVWADAIQRVSELTKS